MQKTLLSEIIQAQNDKYYKKSIILRIENIPLMVADC